MKAKEVTRYEDRIARVCAYIEHNLDDDLTLDVLSDVAAFSKYHFHRVFNAYTGKSLMRFIGIGCRKVVKNVGISHAISDM